mgnify:CR=1 FL=1
MLFRCDGLDLSEAVNKVLKAVSSKTISPILEGIKITAKGDSLTLLATDMEITIEKRIKADVFLVVQIRQFVSCMYQKVQKSGLRFMLLIFLQVVLSLFLEILH